VTIDDEEKAEDDFKITDTIVVAKVADIAILSFILWGVIHVRTEVTQ